jgi:uncharacterized membrane-anchored protein YitT (DUF2179 family)
MKKEELRNYLFITIGSLLLSLGVVWFLTPNQLLTGGTAGLSLLLHYVTPFTIGTIMLAINIPLLLVGMKYLGKMFAIRTIVTLLLISVLIDTFMEVLHVKPFVIDTILASLFGGIFIGIGLALVIKGSSSAGGSTIIAKIIASKTEMKAGQVLLIIDSLIVFSALFIFDDNAKVLWSIVSIYVTSKVIDMILTGRLNKKLVNIVTNNAALLKVKIREDLGEYGTILHGDGLFENQEKTMILIVVEVSKLQYLRELVKKYDSDGFMIITEANEMLGRGH